MTTLTDPGRQELVEQYAAASKAFSDAAEHLRAVCTDTEAFICALSAVGTAHRACEHSRIRLDKHLKSGNAVRVP